MTHPSDWAELPFFLAVVRAGSLRAAAETIGSTHATVDRQVRALEETYGVRLFDRSKSGLKLTAAGEALVPMAEAAEQNVIGARRRLQGLDREAAGTVILSVPTPIAFDVLPPIVAGFSAEYPDIDLEISATNRFEDLTRAEADVSLRIAYEVSDNVVGRRVLQYTRGIFASQAYLDKYWSERGAQGQGLHWIGWRDTVNPPQWVLDSPFPRAAIRHGSRDGLVVSSLVQQGLGMSYLPTYVTHYAPKLVPVPGTVQDPDRSLWILLHTDLRRTTRVRLVVEYLARELKARRAMFTTVSNHDNRRA